MRALRRATLSKIDTYAVSLSSSPVTRASLPGGEEPPQSQPRCAFPARRALRVARLRPRPPRPPPPPHRPPPLSPRRLDAHLSSSALQALLASALILSAPLLAPDEALAARSSGRVGGSSFRSAPRAAPRSAPRSSATARASTNVYVAPSLGGYGGYGGYGYGGLGGFGLGMPPVIIAGGGPVVGYGGGFSLLGSLFQFFAIAAIFQMLLSLFTATNRRKEEGEDEEDTL